MKLTDYNFTLSKPLTPGKHTILVENAGPQPHEVVVAAPGGMAHARDAVVAHMLGADHRYQPLTRHRRQRRLRQPHALERDRVAAARRQRADPLLEHRPRGVGEWRVVAVLAPAPPAHARRRGAHGAR